MDNVIINNAKGIESSLEKLKEDKENEFMVMSGLEYYWEWVESFSRGENRYSYEEIKEELTKVSDMGPPLYKPINLYDEWRQTKDYKKCIQSGELFYGNGLMSLTNEWYGIATWNIQMAIGCFKEIKNKERVREILEHVMGLIDLASVNIEGRYPLDFITLVADNCAFVEKGCLERARDDSLKIAKRFHKNKIFFLERCYLENCLKISRFLKDEESVNEIGRKIAFSHESEAEDRKNDPLTASISYEDALKAYAKIGDKVKIDEMKQKLKKASSKIEFGKISVSTDLDIADFDEYISKLSEFDPITILYAIGSDSSYVPSFEQARETAEAVAKNAPLSYLVPHKSICDDNPVGTSSTPEEIMQSQIKNQFMLDADLRAAHYSRLIKRMIKKGKLNQENIAGFLKKCGISDEILYFVDKGLERYFDNDFVSCIHLFIPQMEPLPREILENHSPGITTLRSEGGIRDTTICSLLEKPETSQVIGKDFCKFLQLYLCDQEHENIRNRLCHGLMKPQDFSEMLSIRLIQILLRLAVLNYNAAQQIKIDKGG